MYDIVLMTNIILKKQEELEWKPAEQPVPGMMILWIVVVFGIMYFLMIRPQKKEQKRLQAMINSLEVGDSIVTTSGFYGVVIDMTEEDVIVESATTRTAVSPMRKQAIAEVEKAEQASA